MVVAKSFLSLEVLLFRFRATRVHSSLAADSVRLPRFACATEFPQFSRDIPTERFGSSERFGAYHAIKDLTITEIVA